MKKESKYALFLLIAISLFVLAQLFAPKSLNWQVTFGKYDKNPYGAQVLNELLQGIFEGQHIDRSNRTLYELSDSLTDNKTLLIIAENVYIDKTDTEALLEKVASGHQVLISADEFYGKLADTLNLSVDNGYFTVPAIGNMVSKDSVSLRFTNPYLSDEQEYTYERTNVDGHFSGFDTLRTSIIAENQGGWPVTLRVRWGKGSLYLNSTPMIFTNNYLLLRENHRFVAKTLSLLPQNDLIWTAYYQEGRQESYTPLRVILKNPALRWAYFLSITAVFTFMVFEAKRKQRIIPILKPLENTSITFTKTVANLYFNKGGHRDMAQKKIKFFMDNIRIKYHLRDTRISNHFFKVLAAKAHQPYEEVVALFHYFEHIENQSSISPEELTTLHQKIENFYKS